MRADAERNRGRIIEAARGLYALQGLGVSMAAVAREAGVGKATLARHFTTPRELIDAVFVDRMNDYAEATREALTVPDPWAGFVGYVWRICEMQARDRGFADLLTLTMPGTPQLDRLKEESFGGFLELIARAKATGLLRDDFESEDLIVLLMANAGVVSATAGASSAAWRRLVGHMLRSYAASETPMPTMPPAPSSPELLAAMARAGDQA